MLAAAKFRCCCLDGSEQDDDLGFITRARDAPARGEAVYDTSWW